MPTLPIGQAGDKEGKKGEITISIVGNKLIITDNGIGIPKDYQLKSSNSFGMQLIGLLAEQLDARISIETEKGTSVEIIFPEKF